MKTGLKPVWAGSNMRLDPFRLPQQVSYATRDDFGDVTFSIDQRGAIVNRTLRSATVVALTPLEVVHFTSETLEELADRVPAFGAALRAAAAGRVGGS